MSNELQVTVIERQVKVTDAPKNITMTLELLACSARDAVEVIRGFIYFGSDRQVLYRVVRYNSLQGALELERVDKPTEK